MRALYVNTNETAAAAEEAPMAGRHLSAVLASWREGAIVGEHALTALTDEAMDLDRQEARRSRARLTTRAPADEHGDGEFAGLWRPQTQAEADRRARAVEEQRVAAAAEMDEDTLYAALFGRSE